MSGIIEEKIKKIHFLKYRKKKKKDIGKHFCHLGNSVMYSDAIKQFMVLRKFLNMPFKKLQIIHKKNLFLKVIKATK